MAEKLSITIALEGAEEIKRQLADIGKAGKKAFARNQPGGAPRSAVSTSSTRSA